MESYSSVDQGKALHDLTTSNLSYKRHNAAISLGQLTETSGEIVQALAGAIALDSNTEVRSAALQALQSPTIQAFLKEHPDFLKVATKSAVDNHAREERASQKEINAEFLRRRARERAYYLIFIGGIVGFYILFIVGLVQEWMNETVVHLWQVVIIGLAVLLYYGSWRNWRCPACDSWLGGFRITINPIWSPDIVRCPHCGRRHQ